MRKLIYLDYAAATPLDPTVMRSMQPFFSDKFHNPSAIYLQARHVRQKLEAARAEVAKELGAKPAGIIFTSGATEANNLALQGVMKNFPGKQAIVSSIEHDSVLAPAKQFNYRLTRVDSQGMVDLDGLKKRINDQTALVSVMLVNNEVGSIQPLKEISAYLRQIRSERKKKGNSLPIYLHSDAAQAPCYLDIHVSRLGVDLLSLNGGKMYGPKQSGVLYANAGVKIEPIILGGGQENGLRSGTENVAGCIGFANALQKSSALRHQEALRLSKLKTTFIAELKQIPGAKINGSPKHSSPHIINVTFAGLDNERLMMQLDESGIQVGLGSACSASDLEPSHVLKAMGLSRSEASSSLRFSFGRPTTAKDISRTIELLGQFSAANR